MAIPLTICNRCGSKYTGAQATYTCTRVSSTVAVWRGTVPTCTGRCNSMASSVPVDTRYNVAACTARTVTAAGCQVKVCVVSTLCLRLSVRYSILEKRKFVEFTYTRVFFFSAPPVSLELPSQLNVASSTVCLNGQLHVLFAVCVS